MNTKNLRRRLLLAGLLPALLLGQQLFAGERQGQEGEGPSKLAQRPGRLVRLNEEKSAGSIVEQISGMLEELRVEDDIRIVAAGEQAVLLYSASADLDDFLSQLESAIRALDKAAQPPPPTESRTVRLFHLRAATALAPVLQAAIDGVKVGAVGNDLLQVSGPRPDLERIGRMVAKLDFPRPQTTFYAWSFQQSKQSSKPRQSRLISDSFQSLRQEVECMNNQLQAAFLRGWNAIREGMPADPEKACQDGGDARVDRDIYCYLAKPYDSETAEGEYTLGYRRALMNSRPSIAKALLLILTAKNPLKLAKQSLCEMNQDPKLACPLEEITDRSETWRESHPGRELNFAQVGQVLHSLLDKEQSRLWAFRAALVDFLFNYKASIQYPDDFMPFDLNRSAHTLNGFFVEVIDAFNKDVEVFVRQLNNSPKLAREGFFDHGLIKTVTLSGTEAQVDARSVSHFDVRAPAGPGAFLETARQLEARLAGQSVEGAPTALSPLALSGSLPGVAGAFAAASQPPLMAEIGRGLTLTIQPTALATASAIELDISLEAGETDVGILGSESAKPSLDRVSRHRVQSTVRVEALRLFEISSFNSRIHLPQSDRLVPVLGHAWSGVFGGVPGLGRLFSYKRDPKQVDHRSMAIVAAIVVPTAFDLALSARFVRDRKGSQVLRLSSQLEKSQARWYCPIYRSGVRAGLDDKEPRECNTHFVESILRYREP